MFYLLLLSHLWVNRSESEDSKDTEDGEALHANSIEDIRIKTGSFKKERKINTALML